MRECSQGGLYQSDCICLIPGEHRGLGAGVSKVRSLKMDRKVWTETLIQVGVPRVIHVWGYVSQLLSSSPISLASELWSWGSSLII